MHKIIKVSKQAKKHITHWEIVVSLPGIELGLLASYSSQGRINQGALGARAPGLPTLRGPHKNDHVLKTMDQNSLEFTTSIIASERNFSLRGSPTVTAVRPVLDSRSDETSIVMSSG